uniref:Uncharacterized protein n=1 Tax=Oryza brachyantha TaxID=4533 RepID=J3LLW9_ORYBR
MASAKPLEEIATCHRCPASSHPISKRLRLQRAKTPRSKLPIIRTKHPRGQGLAKQQGKKAIDLKKTVTSHRCTRASPKRRPQEGYDIERRRRSSEVGTRFSPKELWAWKRNTKTTPPRRETAPTGVAVVKSA